jgi:hypothetical protein
VGTAVILDGSPLAKAVTAGRDYPAVDYPVWRRRLSGRGLSSRGLSVRVPPAHVPPAHVPPVRCPLRARRVSEYVLKLSLRVWVGLRPCPVRPFSPPGPAALRIGSDEYRGPPLIRGYTRNSKLCRLPPGRVHYVASKAEWYLAD